MPLSVKKSTDVKFFEYLSAKVAQHANASGDRKNEKHLSLT